MFRTLLFVSFISVLCGVTQHSQASPSPTFHWVQTDSSLTLRNASQIVWSLIVPQVGKPFIHPVSTIDGIPLTWMHPPDHPWHYGLWFSWKYINGVNYWEEAPDTGLPEGLTIATAFDLQQQPDYSASVKMEITYKQPGQNPVLLEHRELTFSRPDSLGNYSILWMSTFTAETSVQLDRTTILGQPNGKIWGGYPLNRSCRITL